MSNLIVSKKVKKLSEDIAISTMKNANFYPVDRKSLENFLSDILNVNNKEFLLCNLENITNIYTIQLLCCLPELWDDLDNEEIVSFHRNFTNVFSYYAFLSFTYKYLEIDLFEIILKDEKVNSNMKKDICQYFMNTIALLYKDDDDYQEFSPDSLGVDYERISYLKQKMILDGKIPEVTLTPDQLHEKLRSYVLIYKQENKN